MEFSVINLLVGLLFIATVAWLAHSNFHKVQGLMGDRLNASLHRKTDQASLQPLKKVFLDFNHDSVEKWYQWLSNQEGEIQNQAYVKLAGYLTSSPEELGSVTPEVLRGIVLFCKPESFDVIMELVNNLRLHWGRIKSSEIFYIEAIRALLAIDEQMTIDAMETEIDLVKVKEDTDHLKAKLIMLLAGLEDGMRLSHMWVKVLKDEYFPIHAKEEVLRVVEKLDEDCQAKIYAKVVYGYLGIGERELKPDEVSFLEIMFTRARYLVLGGNAHMDLWQALMDACDFVRTKALFVRLLCELLVLPDMDLSEEHLEDLLRKPLEMKEQFAEALAKRFSLQDRELGLTKLPYAQEEAFFNRSSLSSERLGLPMEVAPQLANDYQTLEKHLIDNSEMKTSKITVLAGNGEEEKIYLLRAIAANHKYSFIYVDINSLVIEAKVNDFQQLIHRSKPCIVYFDNILALMERHITDKRERQNMQILVRVLREKAVYPSIITVGSIGYSREDLSSKYKDIETLLQGGTKGDYRLSLDIEKPDENKRRNMVKAFVAQLEDSRRSETEHLLDMEYLITRTGAMSSLELIEYLTKYFERGLLTRGKMMKIEEFDQIVKNDI